MTSSKESVAGERDLRAERLTRWSWLMLPASVVVFAVTSWLTLPLLEARGQSEGDLLAMTEDVAGVALEAGLAIVQLAAPLLGVVFAVRALRVQALGSRWAALGVNGLVVLIVVYQFVDAIRMSFFAPLD